MKIELASALAIHGDKLTSFDARSAYLFVGGFYINVLTIVRGSALSIEQSMLKQKSIHDKWERFATKNFLIELRTLECDSEGMRRLKLILAELEDWESTDRLHTEDIDEVDFDARDAVKALTQRYDRLQLDSDFQWPGLEGKGSLAAAHISFKPLARYPQLRTMTSLQAFDSRINAGVLQAASAVLGLKGTDESLALGAYIGLPI